MTRLFEKAYLQYIVEDYKILPNYGTAKMLELGYRLNREQFLKKLTLDDAFYKRFGLGCCRTLSFWERRNLAWSYAVKNNLLPLYIDAHGKTGSDEYMTVIDSTGWEIPKREVRLESEDLHDRVCRKLISSKKLPFNLKLKQNYYF